MELFDTHCHIQSAGLKQGERTTRDMWAKAGNTSVDEIIARANDAGVSHMICVGCDVDDSMLAVQTVQDRDNLYASIGIHPHEAQRYVNDTAEKSRFSGLAAYEKVVAVGECGLDYFYTHSPKEAQVEILKFQLDLGRKHDLPMIFHVREAFDDFWPVFEQFSGIRGILHSFTDSIENMQRAVAQGLCIGVNGIATFAKSESQLAMYKAIPLENLVLETDAPFLTPVPFRGTICEPKHIALTAQFLADLRGEPVEELVRMTTQNARKLFNV